MTGWVTRSVSDANSEEKGGYEWEEETGTEENEGTVRGRLE
jgi:hypothetical protein